MCGGRRESEILKDLPTHRTDKRNISLSWLFPKNCSRHDKNYIHKQIKLDRLNTWIWEVKKWICFSSNFVQIPSCTDAKLNIMFMWRIKYFLTPSLNCKCFVQCTLHTYCEEMRKSFYHFSVLGGGRGWHYVYRMFKREKVH